MPTLLEFDDLTRRVGQLICENRCGFRGEQPCYAINSAWPPGTCDEPGCEAIGRSVAHLVGPMLDAKDARITHLMDLLNTERSFHRTTYEELCNARASLHATEAEVVRWRASHRALVETRKDKT